MFYGYVQKLTLILFDQRSKLILIIKKPKLTLALYFLELANDLKGISIYYNFCDAFLTLGPEIYSYI